jgi:hypothetical protein
MYDALALLIVIAAAAYALRRYAQGFLQSYADAVLRRMRGRGLASSVIEIRATDAAAGCSTPCSSCSGCRSH